MEQEVIAPVTANAKKPFSWKRVTVHSLAGFGGLILAFSLLTSVLESMFEPIGFSQRQAAQANLAAIKSALNEYALLNGERYPEDLGVLCEPDTNGVTWLGRTKLPIDPWKQEYYYWLTQGGKDFVLETLGKDGEPGGRGDNRDFRLTAVLDDSE